MFDVGEEKLPPELVYLLRLFPEVIYCIWLFQTGVQGASTGLCNDNSSVGQYNDNTTI